MKAAPTTKVLPDSVAALYAVVVGCAIYRHEPWADEAQAWLLARDGSLYDLWTRLLHYEGSPGLWHTLLHSFISLGLPYGGLNVISGLLGCAAAWLILRYAPLPLPVRVLLPFTFFLCYQYAVIARSYSLVPVLLFGCAIVYPNAVRRLSLFVCLLLLLASVSVQAFSLSVAIALAFLALPVAQWTALSSPDRRKLMVAAGTYAVGLAFIALAAWPARDVAFPFHVEFAFLRLLQVAGIMFSQAFTGVWMVSLGAIGLSVPFLWRGRGLLTFILASLLLCAVSAIVYWNPWQQGLLFLAWLFAIWISAQSTKFTAAPFAAVVIVAGVQCYWSVRSLRYDWISPYSGSMQAASYIRGAGISGQPMYAIGYSCTAIQPYFSRNVFTNFDHAFWDWSNRNRAMDPSPLFSALSPAYVIAGKEAAAGTMQWKNILAMGGYTPVQHFDGGLFWQTHILEPQSFDLYRRDRAINSGDILSVLSMPDAAAANQLLYGFYGLESNTWRWTARKFAVLLKTPASSAVIRLQVTIPEIQIRNLGPMTLTAEIDGHSLTSETYSHSGTYTYTREVPTGVRIGAVPLSFSFDKATPPSASEARELGAIIASIGVYAK